MKNAFYLILKKSSFRFEDISVFITAFWSCRNNDLIRMIRLVSKSMTSQHGKQTIAIHIFPNTLRNKSNQAVNFGQLIEYNMRNISLNNKAPFSADSEKGNFSVASNQPKIKLRELKIQNLTQKLRTGKPFSNNLDL